MPFKDPQVAREYARLYAQKLRKDPLQMVRMREANRRWYKNNPHKTKIRNAKNNAQPYAKAAAKRYRQSIHGKMVRALAESLRRGRKANATGQCSSEQWEARRAFYGWKCWLRLPGCTNQGTTVDHVIPISRGGSNWPSNLRPACKHCNSTKGNRPIKPEILAALTP